MKRDSRKKQPNNKVLMYSAVGVLSLLAIAFALLMYGQSVNEGIGQSQFSPEQIASIGENETESESASSSIGKSVEEEAAVQIQENTTSNTTTQTNATNDMNKNTTSNTISTNAGNTTNSNTTNSTSMQTTSSTASTKNSNNEKNANQTNTKDTTKKDLSFQMPVQGEVMREFAKENLVFSETLQEWMTHTGIDIKAEKGTVVQAAEAGTIKSIKNDPRFGLTITIEHGNGFETIYANLLSTEFVTEGENVTKGQSIGTVGNTASFESADAPHLHFEVLKDSVQEDPSIYVK